MKVTVRDALEFSVLAEGLGFPEGPVFGADGTVYAVDVDRGVIWQMSGGEASVAATPGAGPNGMALETPTSAVVANNGGFLTEGDRFPHPYRLRHPHERATRLRRRMARAGRPRDGRRHGAAPGLRRPTAQRTERSRVRRSGGIWFTARTARAVAKSVDRGGLYYVPL